MIVFQSSLTGVAGLPSFNAKSAAWIPSPSGRGIEGEGELNHRGRPSPRAGILRLCAFYPNLCASVSLCPSTEAFPPATVPRRKTGAKADLSSIALAKEEAWLLVPGASSRPLALRQRHLQKGGLRSLKPFSRILGKFNQF